MLFGPAAEFGQLRMQRGFAARELEDFDLPFAGDDAIHPCLNVHHRDGIHLGTDANRRVRVAGRTSKIAGVHNLDQGQASGERLDGMAAATFRVAAQRACRLALRRAARPTRAAAVLLLALRQPVKPRITGDAGTELPMRHAAPLQIHLPILLLHRGRARLVAFRTARGGAFEEGRSHRPMFMSFTSVIQPTKADANINAQPPKSRPTARQPERPRPSLMAEMKCRIRMIATPIQKNGGPHLESGKRSTNGRETPGAITVARIQDNHQPPPAGGTGCGVSGVSSLMSQG